VDNRTRSPSYPSTSLEQAIEIVRRLHREERTNTVDREVAAKAIGYSGLTGRSATILSDLSQYGLVERTGKSGLRVSALAVDILHPDDRHSLAAALREAAQKPDLYQRIMERFTDGLPSQNALESFLVKQGFTFVAIPPAVRAFKETFSYLENATGSESNSPATRPMTDSVLDQGLDEATTMEREQLTPPARAVPPAATSYPFAGLSVVGPDVRLVNKQIHIAGVLETQADVDDVIETLTFLRSKVKPAPSEPVPETFTMAPEPIKEG
jgi:hypothetical protein